MRGGRSPRARSTSCARSWTTRKRISRVSSSRSPDAMRDRSSSPLRALIALELRELARARPTLLLLLIAGPLVGHAFSTAVATYAEASGGAGGAAALAQGLSPLDGLVVPTLGAYALIATLVLP